MQKSFDQVKGQLWGRLKPFYEKHAGENGQIKNSEIQILVRQVFEDASQPQIDYIIKNMHRLDPDGSGYVSFGQFANFLFRTHCGQLSLQRRHIKGKMVRGKQKLMNLQEFQILLNAAIAFLKVQVPKDISTTIFQQTDTDKDGNITYIEYFMAIDKYICKSKIELEQEGSKTKKQIVFPEPEQKIIIQRRFRDYIWSQLTKLYECYAMGRMLLMSQLRSLVIYICSDLSETQITYILTGLYMLQGQHIDFVAFASRFLYLLAQIGLSRFSLNRSRELRTITLQDFIILMFNSWKYFNIRAISGSYLSLIYTSILRSRSIVTYEMYLEWITHYLSIIHYYGGVFDFLQDDPDDENGDKLFFQMKAKPHVNPISPSKVKNEKIIQYKFSNYDLAYLVRQRMLDALIKYDHNKDHLFSEDEIRQALHELLGENQHELDYVTRNVFRYDVDGDKNVTYDELTNFSVEQHFGEMAIQRLHRKKFYSRGSERIMNETEFGKTLNYALKVLNLEASPQQIAKLFSEVDLDQDGWIHYEVYFLFLVFYFGSKSYAYFNPKKTRKSMTFYEELMKILQGLKGMDRFIKLLMYQLKLQFLLFDDNGNLSFEPNEIQSILMHLFHFNEMQIRMIMREIFRVNIQYKTTISFDDLSAIILNIYFVYIVCLRRYEQVGRSGWKRIKISQAEFITLMTEECYFLSIKPFQEDLIIIFQMLDTDNDGYITIQEYIAFIRKYIGRGISLYDEPPEVPSPVKKKPPTEVTEEQFEFISAIWDELKALFDRYDQGHKGYLSQQQFKLFAVQVLNEKSDNELKYIFWNLFRLDSNFDKKISFEEFAPYVLKHAGEISLQRFHLQQIKGKSSLSQDDLFIVISNAYGFLSTMPKSKSIITKIYSRIAKANGVDYGSYLGWISKAVAARYN